jgi:hypothetical protein
MVRIGESIEKEFEGDDVHLTGEGVVGGGGRVAGASTDSVSVSTAGGRLGGMRKCRHSLLSSSREIER